MGLSRLLGGGLMEGAKSIAETVAKYKSKKLDAAATLMALENELPRLQAEITKVEASHPNMFISGWRPAVGWVCVVGLGYSFLLQPILNGLLPTDPFPRIDMDQLIALLLAMLGIATNRTVEKLKGAARD